MAEVKLTKNELRLQQARLAQLKKYLPTLQLKKAMLQTEVQGARLEIQEFEQNFSRIHKQVEEYSGLLVEKTTLDPKAVAKVVDIQKNYENIAGVEVPYFHGVTFASVDYNLFDSPPWVDGVVTGLRGIAEARIKVVIAEEKKAALEAELRQVSIRVNLFEKILIPRATQNIKRIKVFLGDQQLAAVSRAKVAKNIIEEQKREHKKALEEHLHAL